MASSSRSDAELVLAFAGRSLRVRSAAPEVLDAVDLLLGTHRVDGPAPAAPLLEITRTRDGYQLVGADPDTPSKITADLLESTLSRVLLYRLVEHNAEHLMLHAAALEYHGRGLLCIAPAGGGKTTLSAWLLGQGFHYLTDELAAVDPTHRVEGLARPLNVKSTGLDLVRSFTWLESDLGRARVSGGITHIPRRESHPAPLPIAALLLPRFVPGADFSVTTPSVGQCAATMMRSLLNARNLPRHGLAGVVALARAVPIYAPQYGELEDVSSWLRGLLDGTDR